MIQYDAINTITETIIKDGLIDACFLKGSIARGEEDEYSDVDLYCLVSPENFEKFLDKRAKYLESYQMIQYIEEVNFVGPQIVCIFDNGLHFDLYTILFDQLNTYDQIMVIYDPKKILANYQTQYLQLKPAEIAQIVNSFSFTLIEFNAAYRRKDLVFALRLANHLHANYSTVLRYFKDPKKAKIAIKGLVKQLKDDDLQKYLYVTKLLKYDSCLLAVKTLILMMHDLIINLPINIAEFVNYDFFMFGKKLIYSIDEEK